MLIPSSFMDDFRKAAHLYLLNAFAMNYVNISDFPNSTASIVFVGVTGCCALTCFACICYKCCCGKKSIHVKSSQLSKEYFNKSDKNKDNVLGVEEMRDLLQKTYKVKMSLPQTRVLIDRYDKNGDRKFTYREYKAMMEDLEDQDEYDGDEGDIRDILRNIQAPVDSYKREAREAAKRRAELRAASNT